jgi:hypothetical protein
MACTLAGDFLGIFFPPKLKIYFLFLANLVLGDRPRACPTTAAGRHGSMSKNGFSVWGKKSFPKIPALPVVGSPEVKKPPNPFPKNGSLPRVGRGFLGKKKYMS